MASASYYKRLYKEAKAEEEKYKDYKEDLQDIKNGIVNNLPEEISDVNEKISELVEALTGAVRHGTTFTSNLESISEQKEGAVDSCAIKTDSSLSSILSSLNREITSLGGKQETARNNKDYYYDKYEEAKEQEENASLAFWGLD